jgi:ketosteroid isomerase-like protein
VGDQSNVELVTSIYDAFARGDIPAILKCLDSQAELIFEGSSAIPWAGNRGGHDGWLSFFQAIGESLDEVKFAETMKPFAVQGDHLVFSGRYSARVKSTGKRIDSPLVHLWTVRNGSVVRCHELTNTALEAAACMAGTAAV